MIVQPFKRWRLRRSIARHKRSIDEGLMALGPKADMARALGSLAMLRDSVSGIGQLMSKTSKEIEAFGAALREVSR